MALPPVIVREVWASNLDTEFLLIHNAIMSGFRFASMDTEFPGTIFELPSHVPKQAYSRLPPQQYYTLMKKNVDELRIIQLGLTLFDAHGNLPHFYTPSRYVWQFNFCDFDKKLHPHNKDSISLLEKQGIDFSENKRNGINSRVFSLKLGFWVLRQRLIWITFQGSYDFALLIKIITGQELPDDVRDFMTLVGAYFGEGSFDVKVITRFLGLHGGLEKVGRSLGLGRAAGKSHQAGSDSLLTMQVFMELSRKGKFVGFNHKLYGLTGVVEPKEVYVC